MLTLVRSLRLRGLVAATLICGVTAPAWSQEMPTEAATPAAQPATTPEAIRQQFETAIQAQQKRRSGAITGIIIGGVIIGAGVIATVVKSANDEDEEADENGGYYDDEVEIDWTGAAIGGVIGGSIIGFSIPKLVDANRQLRQLNRQRPKLSLVPAQDGFRIALSLDL